MTEPGPYDHRTNFGPIDHLANSIITRLPHDAPKTYLRATGFRFFFILLNKIVAATASMNPYGSCTAAACFRTEAAR